MIQYPRLKNGSRSRQLLEVFKGYNRSERIGSGEFTDMENLTSDDYPVLRPRGKRGLFASSKDGGRSTGALYIPGTGIFMSIDQGGSQDAEGQAGCLFLLTPEGKVQCISDTLTPGRKSFALMGDTLIVAPDMKAVRLEDLYCMDMGYSSEITGGVLHCRPCRADGSEYDNFMSSAFAPVSPVDMMVWADTSVYPCVLRQYSSIQEEWVPLTTTYIRIWGGGGNVFDEHYIFAGDGITISGMGDDMYFLNGSHVVQDAGHGYIVIPGVVDGNRSLSVFNPVLFERKVPALDFIVESGNRLWGCIKNTNEIYACKLGDWSNWNCFQGLSTDSWVGTIGTPGEFTGAVVQNGYPIFYKENYKHKVWPSAAGAHQITVTECSGVEKGSENSIAVLDGTVFYKSPLGVCADDGGGVVEIGHKLGDMRYGSAAGAIHDRKYYLNMSDSNGENHLFVYDIYRKLWHREDSPVSGCLVSGGNRLYTASGGDIWDLTGNTGTLEKEVSWMAVTGDLGLELPEQKYISHLTLRLCLEPGATLEIFARYDRQQEWVKLGQVYGTDLRSFSLPVRPRRCDQLRLKLQGTGMCKLYSITKTLERGSELS